MANLEPEITIEETKAMKLRLDELIAGKDFSAHP